MGKKPTLTIIIATYNRAKSLQECLLSLTKQTNRDFSVLVIDGGSTDKTPEILQRYKRKLDIKVITDNAPHLSYIRDLGWRKAHTDLVAWVDDDTVLERQWAASVKSAFKDKAVGGVSGPTVIPEKLLKKRDVFYFHTTQTKTGKLLVWTYFSLFMQGEKYGIGKIYPSCAWSPGSNFPLSKRLKQPIEVDYLEACNFAVKRGVMKKINGFDLEYKGTSEWCEVDVAFRIRKKGYKLLFDPKIAVEHRVSNGGVYGRRKNAFHRLCNTVRFYVYSYYPKSPKSWCLFLLYMLFLLIYSFKLISGNIVKKFGKSLPASS